MLKLSNIEKKIASLVAFYGSENEDKVFTAFFEYAKRLAASEKYPFFAIGSYIEIYNLAKRKQLNKKKQSRQRLAKEDIPFVTQLFTPYDIVCYIVDNTLARLSPLINGDDLPFYDKFSEFPPNNSPKNIQDIRIIDLACGTGNILYIVIDRLKAAYAKLGYNACDTARLISANIIGLDIDKRMTSIAQENLSEYLGAPITIYTLDSPRDAVLDILKTLNLYNLADAFINIYERGSLSIFDIEELNILKNNLQFYKDNPAIYEELLHIIAIGDTLSAKYDAILINPPYLASSDYSPSLNAFITANYKDYRQDLFATFIYHSLDLLQPDGYLGVVCPYNWMFIRQFVKLRELIIESHGITNLAKFAISGYKSAVVYLSAFVLSSTNNTEHRGSYIDLSHKKDDILLENCCKNLTPLTFIKNQSDFLLAPTFAIIFWTSTQFLQNFSAPKLASVMDIRQGMATGNNNYYLKKIDEVDNKLIAITASSLAEFCAQPLPYALYSKGGKYRKWYGNIEYVIKFDSASRAKLSKVGNHLPSKRFYFRPAITWTLVSSKGVFGARILHNSVFDVGGSCGFPKDDKDIYVILAYLCSGVATAYINALNPTINCQVGDIKNLPYIAPPPRLCAIIEKLVKENIAIAKDDWETYYVNHLQFPKEKRLAYCSTIKSNEETLNNIFIELYRLQSDITSSVADKYITLFCKNLD